MPDESCRSCGEELVTYSSCSECRKVTQRICRSCNTPTRKQFHSKCIKSEVISNSKRNQVIQLVKMDVMPRKPIASSRSLVVVIGVISFLVLGVSSVAYLGLFQNSSLTPDSPVLHNISTAEPVKSPVAENSPQSGISLTGKSYQNCLAYGSGQFLTVTCPTQYGFVYKAVLDMPKDLAEKFSDAVFSIRGLDLMENLDGSVILQYQNSNYKTNFFVS